MKYRNVTLTTEGDIMDARFEGESSFDGERWHRFSSWMPLHVIHRVFGASDMPEEASYRIYDLSDGYGEQGYVPPQGYDWSGIRDSSPEAIQQMLAVALEYVTMDKILDELGLKVAA